MAVKSPLAKILLRPLATSVLFAVLYGIYLTLSHQPQIPLTLFVVIGFYFAVPELHCAGENRCDAQKRAVWRRVFRSIVKDLAASLTAPGRAMGRLWGFH